MEVSLTFIIMAISFGPGGKTVLGALCALAGGISFAFWLIIQAKLSKRYPSHYSSTALMSFWASLLSILLALCFERDLSQWRLGWNVRLLTVAYAGIVVSGVVVVVISWCIRMRGPLFASVFNPLVLVPIADKLLPESFQDLAGFNLNSDENLEEKEKLVFICSCAIECVKGGGSVLIPIDRLGTILQLLEEMTTSLEASAMGSFVGIYNSNING